MPLNLKFLSIGLSSLTPPLGQQQPGLAHLATHKASAAYTSLFWHHLKYKQTFYVTWHTIHFFYILWHYNDFLFLIQHLPTIPLHCYQPYREWLRQLISIDSFPLTHFHWLISIDSFPLTHFHWLIWHYRIPNTLLWPQPQICPACILYNSDVDLCWKWTQNPFFWSEKLKTENGGLPTWKRERQKRRARPQN